MYKLGGTNMAESVSTKKAIAKGFKELMGFKHFDKITISDITNRCHLNRQTFYYHFRDKYDLLNWIYYTEAICYLTEGLTFDNWSSRVCAMLTEMKRNDYFYINAFKSSGSAEFESYIHHAIRNMFVRIIDDVDPGLEIGREDRDFIADFYAYGVVGIIIDWAVGGMRESPESLRSRFESLVMGTRRLSLQRWTDSRGDRSRTGR